MQSAVLLGRVSRDDKQQDPENQLGPLRAAAARRGVVVLREVPFKLSAWDEKEARMVWTAVLQALDETRADTLMVWAVDRVSRGGIEDTFRKVRELDHRGVGLYSLHEPFLSTVDTQTRELLLALLAWAAKWESQRKSDRLRAKLATKKREAAKLGQRARWGRGISPLESDVEVMRAMRAQDKTLEEIATATGFGRGTVWRALRQFPNPPPGAGGNAPSVGEVPPSLGGGKQEDRQHDG